MTIGEILNKNRENRGYSVQKLSELLGVSKKAVQDQEEDVSKPDLLESLLLSILYGITLEDMFCDLNPEAVLTGEKKTDFEHEKWLNRIGNREYQVVKYLKIKRDGKCGVW